MGQVLNVGLVVSMIVLWVVVNNYLCEMLDTLDVFLSFVQMANVRLIECTVKRIVAATCRLPLLSVVCAAGYRRNQCCMA
jgi:hypothetical protein